MSFLISCFLILTIIFTILSAFQNSIMYSLFYLGISIVTTSAVFFLLGDYLIGSLQIIIYSGAIIVLFIFVIMMFNIEHKIKKRYFFLNYFRCFLFIISIFLIFFFLFFNILFYLRYKQVVVLIDNLHTLGIVLFQPYILITECLSILLLSALIIVLLISKNDLVSLKLSKDRI
ncbi:NADH-quinone oxidoreductase subunit J [Buchnera aphidicola]|uniref:NADH-quinone oxidoreductase subunit J family protein n=1 Tax=Buchnera aphidicola TaxID=9 RepID=UPI003464329E